MLPETKLLAEMLKERLATLPAQTVVPPAVVNMSPQPPAVNVAAPKVEVHNHVPKSEVHNHVAVPTVTVNLDVDALAIAVAAAVKPAQGPSVHNHVAVPEVQNAINIDTEALATAITAALGPVLAEVHRALLGVRQAAATVATAVSEQKRPFVKVQVPEQPTPQVHVPAPKARSFIIEHPDGKKSTVTEVTK